MTADIVTDALSMAWFRRKPEVGVVFHSDRGSQPASHAMRDKLVEYGMTASMSRKGNCWDTQSTIGPSAASGLNPVLVSLKTTLRLLAKRWNALHDELFRELDKQLTRLTKLAAPRLLGRFGV
jgi:transposase InsO family protein